MGCGAGQGICRCQATLGTTVDGRTAPGAGCRDAGGCAGSVGRGAARRDYGEYGGSARNGIGATIWRTRRHRWRARWPHRRSHCDGAHACRRGARNVDRARRHPARDRGRDRRGCRGRPTGPLCHHCAGARRTRVKRCISARHHWSCRCASATTVSYRTLPRRAPLASNLRSSGCLASRWTSISPRTCTL